MANIDTAGLAAKFFREFFENNDNQMPSQTFSEFIDDTLLPIIQNSGEELKREEIIDMFFTSVGKQYDNDASRSLLTTALKRLSDKGLINHTDHGYYKAK